MAESYLFCYLFSILPMALCQLHSLSISLCSPPLFSSRCSHCLAGCPAFLHASAFIGAPNLGSAEGGHPDLFRLPRFLPICSDLRSLFSGFLPISSDFLTFSSDLFRFVPICFQNKSEQIRETPFRRPLLQIPDFTIGDGPNTVSKSTGLGREKSNKRREIWRDISTSGPQPPVDMSRLSHRNVPSVPWTFRRLYVELHRDQVGTSRCPGDTPPNRPLGHFRGIPTTKFLYVFFVDRFFSFP